MKIKCVLIDDEPLAIKVLQNYFTNFTDFEVIATFNNSLEALDFINSTAVDAVFLDINMPMMTGFELISLIESKTKVIITTAFREFAAESYDLDVLDYLVKPIPLPRFIKCINKITTEYNLKNNIKVETTKGDSHIFIKVDKKMMKINIEEILFVEGMKEYIKVVTPDKTYITHKSLTSLSEELPADRFLRIHKSYVIALNKVKSIEGNRVQIQSYNIPIGRNYSKEVKNKILE
ncbi:MULTISPECIES: LytTR family DNA-binding domain-containing protein [unclassified Flavobacterium]|jgi:two-component system LytT family response regulator|uniref:LytR/AlgR family response regulator transcription factor n=1 Tax=Flavobacterium TaxID=237 RepID=UPI00070F8B29|nr:MULTISPECIES: LytTR family DNA-binding domain-containing protein [unclassified Flavobacterium]KRD61464.1 two-component system response regulator [Flavobacterium sp. Root935]MCV2483308.1 LytTR family DNA-binding domain-containing protein [Flavobacterium sp. SH_e]MDQ1166673.1 two-component system LytT family response regulator [Flavobacterium sp. SORGH_AS_0622]TDX12670.1 LytTR family two component transcriptional regulator [Flavobacterium sp. S87F.05.LMB.W.Kidney.N]BDU27145.1 DNA-binding resp